MSEQRCENWTPEAHGPCGLCAVCLPADPTSRVSTQAPPDDYEWARERVETLCASALADAHVYGRKLLKGFGYPNETFRAAQDYRALKIVLDRLPQRTSPQEARPAPWMPIETAPKTSRHILVWTPANHCAALVVWGTAYDPAGRWEHAYGGGHRLCDEPSHWRPLPPAPGVDGGE